MIASSAPAKEEKRRPARNPKKKNKTEDRYPQMPTAIWYRRKGRYVHVSHEKTPEIGEVFPNEKREKGPGGHLNEESLRGGGGGGT